MQANLDLRLQNLMQNCSKRMNQLFMQYLVNIPSLELKKAMEYSLLNESSKYLRPLLIYATGDIFTAPLPNLDIPACAVELIHTYSLIHDDLPCMDDADLRRGKPACHKVFGEGMAVLTGDALHTLAMQVISMQPAPLNEVKRLAMIKVLAQACGPYGMAAGQALDLSVMQDKSISSELLTDIYQLKTGSLISACVELGRLASDDDDEIHKETLTNYARYLGLAFQIQDDILDIEATEEILGKPRGIDNENNKITYPKLFGLTTAKLTVENLYGRALEAINYLGERAHLLRELTNFMLRRVF